MNSLSRLGCTAIAALAATTTLAADSPSINVEVGGVEVTTPAQPDPSDAPSRSTCMNHCTAANVKCGSEVRRARQECSRRASTGGRDPLTGRDDARDPFTGRSDHTYFCGYFSNPAMHCGSDIYSGSCQARLNHRYGLCVDAMRDNSISSMRVDCMRAERDTQNLCRDELQDCKAARESAPE